MNKILSFLLAYGFITRTSGDNMYCKFPSSNAHIPIRSGAGAQLSIEYSATVSANSIVRRNPNGTIQAANAVNGGECATLGQLNSRLSSNQRTAINSLDAGTSTVADVINALKAP